MDSHLNSEKKNFLRWNCCNVDVKLCLFSADVAPPVSSPSQPTDESLDSSYKKVESESSISKLLKKPIDADAEKPAAMNGNVVSVVIKGTLQQKW